MAPKYHLFYEILKNQLIRLPFVRSLAKLFHNTGINQDPNKVVCTYDFYRRAAHQAGAVILELGPGQTWQVGYQFLLDGAKTVYLCDTDRYFPDSALISNSLVFNQYNGKDLPYPSESIDLICSYNVYEHLRFPETTVHETQRVLKRGGVIICSIDLRDHLFDLESPDIFDCLRYSREQWNAMTWHRSLYVNRMRASDWIQLHIEAGFDIRWTNSFESSVARRHFLNGKLKYLRAFRSSDRFIHRIELIAVKT